jgi:Sulfotransferase domain
MDSEIILVSGLPRSGTSLMMQMLEKGGVEIVTDHLRTADTDNPRGYYEFEKVKRIKQDASWLPQMRGKALKIVSQLLYDLPPRERYRIIFMERDLDEVLLSQEKMLERLGRAAIPRPQMERSYTIHLERLRAWLGRQQNQTVLWVGYNELLTAPEPHARRVSDFLGGRANTEKMIQSVDPALYRNRKTQGAESLQPGQGGA